MIRVFYPTRARLSFLRAHAQNILKTAEYLAREKNISIEVFSAALEPKTAEDLFRDKNICNPFFLNVSQSRRSLLRAFWVRRREFDVLYFRDPFLFPYALAARFVLGKKVIFEAHGSHEWRFARPVWRFALSSAHGAVFITKALGDYYQIQKPHIVVHTNGVELADFESLPPKPVLRGALGLSQGKIIIMYLGSFLWYSADILKAVIWQMPANVMLVVVGAKGSEKKLFEKEVHAGRAQVISRVAPRDVPQHLAAADILVNPLAISYPGSISSKLYEYLAASKPIVSSAGGANREILRDGENALVVDELDAHVFADAVGRVLSDPALAKKLSRNARKDAAQYTWQARAKKIAAFIEHIVWEGRGELVTW